MTAIIFFINPPIRDKVSQVELSGNSGQLDHSLSRLRTMTSLTIESSRLMQSCSHLSLPPMRRILSNDTIIILALCWSVYRRTPDPAQAVQIVLSSPCMTSRVPAHVVQN